MRTSVSPIDPVGLRSAPAARGQNRRGIDNVAFDFFALQNAVDPEAVQSGLLDGDELAKSRPVRPRAFSLSWANRMSKPATSPARIKCFDIFSPAAGE